MNGKDWQALGARFGAAVARGIESAAAAKRWGVCRTCKAPIGGHSPGQICEGCHADAVLARGLGGRPGGEA